MGFTKKTNNGIKYIKILGLKKDEPKHYYTLDGEIIEDNNFNGKLIKIENSSYEYEGILRQTIKLLFIDDIHEYYQLDISFNSLSRSLINSLLGTVDSYFRKGIKKGSINLEMSLYINKEGYKQIGIKINGDRGIWRYSIEEQKKLIETIIKKNGTKENDYFEYDEKLRQGVDYINDFITISDFIDEIVLEGKTEEIKIEKVKEKIEEISVEDIPF